MSIGDGEDLDDSGFGETSRYAAHLDRGWSLLDRSDYEAARQSALQAQRIRPDAPDAAVLLGAIALAEGDPVESLRWYDQAIELDPDYFEPYAAAAQIALFDLGDAARALQFCDDGLGVESVSAIDALDLELLGAECLVSLGRDEEARARLDALREHPLFAAILRASIEAGEHGEPDMSSRPSSDEQEEVDLDSSVRRRRRRPPVRDDAHEAEDDAGEAAAVAELEEDDEDEADAQAAVAELDEDEDGEPLDEEERSAQVQRVLQFILRMCRLWLDLGAPESALPALRAAAERFPNNADAWHLLSEAEYARGDTRAACHAALRVYRLDQQHSPPKWLPGPAQLHRKVVQILSSCPDETLRELGQRRAALVLLVHEVPSLELVLEGVDPRISALSLATRGGSDDEPPELTGLAIYRRNLVRLARSAEQFDHELRFAVLEELANFFQLSDARRERLGLPPLAADVDYIEDEPPPPPALEDDDASAPRRRRRKKKRMHS
jgi:tetratricopeptide (TPR) repeat protein